MELLDLCRIKRSVVLFDLPANPFILKSHLTKRLLHGESTLTPAQRGMLLAEGLPAELINLLGDKES